MHFPAHPRIDLLLTSKRKAAILLLDAYRKHQNRRFAGHAGPDGTAHARNHGTATRIRAGQTNPADLPRRAGPEPGNAVSGSAAARAERLGAIEMGNVRQQPPRQAL